MLSRKFFRCDLWREEREYSRAEAWLDLIASASFVSESTIIEGRCLSLARGELAASVRYLAVRWGWAKTTTERFLAMLKAQDRIAVRQEQGISILRLLKYEDYNSGQEAGQQTGRTLPSEVPKNRDAERDENGTVAGQSRDKSKKEIIQEEKNKSIPADKPPVEPVPTSKKRDWREENRKLALEANLIDPPMLAPQQFVESWQHWRQYRTRRAVDAATSSAALPWTRHAAEAAMRECERAAATHGWEAVCARIDTAIAGNWQGLNLQTMQTLNGAPRTQQTRQGREESALQKPGRKF